MWLRPTHTNQEPTQPKEEQPQLKGTVITLKTVLSQLQDPSEGPDVWEHLTLLNEFKLLFLCEDAWSGSLNDRSRGRRVGSI